MSSVPRGLDYSVKSTLMGNWMAELSLDVLEPGSCVSLSSYSVVTGNNENTESLRAPSLTGRYQKPPRTNYPPF